MEILSNLAWGAVALALWALWLNGQLRRRDGRAGSLLPGLGVQLVALAMLSAVLLPVISITDDLQSSNIPAEVERTLPRNDRHFALGHVDHQAPAHMALPAVDPAPSGLHCIALLHGAMPLPPQALVYGHEQWSRPPPAA